MDLGFLIGSLLLTMHKRIGLLTTMKPQRELSTEIHLSKGTTNYSASLNNSYSPIYIHLEYSLLF